MSIRNNYPTVNPTLDLDFANTRRLDPRVTFTRSSTATYYDGSKALAEQNLLLNSQTFNTTWVASSITFATGITDPLGTTTAYTATASGANATVYQSVIIPADTFTFSIYIQRVTGTGTINLTLDGTTMTVASVTGSWVRYTATQALTAGTYTVGIKIVTSGDAVNIWGAQLEQRSSASAYNVTTTSIVANYISVLKTAAINQPRFDVDPVTGESKGLLIEEQRTNLLTYSEQFDNAVWGKFGGATVTANTVIAPDGTLTADTLNITTGGIYQQISASPTVTYVFSIYLKAASNTTSRLVINTNLSDPVAQTVSVTTSWQRFTVTKTVSAGTNAIAAQIDSFSGANIVYAWGAQLEVGAFPTSYIPTTSAQVTRTADNASMTGTAFSSWYNQSEGTFNVNIDSGNTANALDTSGSARGALYVSDGTTTNRYRIGALVTTYIVTSGGVLSADISAGTLAANTDYKLASTYAVNSYQFANNGLLATEDTLGNLPISVNQIQLGISGLSSGYLNGHIKSIRYYPARVTNAQLQALTSI